MNDTQGNLSPSMRIIEKTADKKGADPADLPPLFDVTDPDALERLIASVKDQTNQKLAVSFQYGGYSVTIDDNGHVDLSG